MGRLANTVQHEASEHAVMFLQPTTQAMTITL
jgi:hypothetical protein